MSPSTSAHASVAAVFGPYLPLAESAPHDDASDAKPTVLASLPNTHGAVKPAGIADLLVVRQHVLGYAAGEVAYVENVAQGEKLVRKSRRSELVEDIVTTISEAVREQQRDVQATDRFDLRSESNEVLRSDASRTPGSGASAAYGALVETGGSTEQAQRTAETFGRDVATRAVSLVSERLRSETTHRTVQRFEEDVRHEFDNTAGASHEVVVYQWLDRVIEAQLFTFGKRVFYDLVVPEPAALLLRSAAARRTPEGPLVKPARFTLSPGQLNEVNYLYYVAGYGATGVAPPPDPQRVVSDSIASASQNRFSPQAEVRSIHEVYKNKLTIPPGYRAVNASIHFMGSTDDRDRVCFGITIGNHYYDLAHVLVDGKSIALDGEVGSIPVALVNSEGDSFFTVNVELWCEPTDRAMDEWRQRTWDAIMLASRQRLQEYEERAANLRAVLRTDALNFTQERKRATEREELERACIEVLTGQHFDGLSAIEHSPQGYPQSFLPNVEPLGRYVRFLQQAFEWEQMTWRTYPYFWGRKSYWIDKLLLDDSDAQFRDFLRAGSARVMLPVRPGFEGAVAHFMETGSVPTIEELGQMASGLYLPLLEESIGTDVAIEKATPYGEPWQLRAPTKLVKVRSSNTLPTWTSAVDAQGRVVWNAGVGDPL
ncbi:MAG: hypothetical protein ABW186_11690 [Rhodanobacteraceae bacterium]